MNNLSTYPGKSTPVAVGCGQNRGWMMWFFMQRWGSLQRFLRQAAGLVLLVIVLCISFSCGLARAADQVPDADKALKRFPDVRWYDEAAGGYKPPVLVDPTDNPLRTEGWRTPPQAAYSWDWMDNWNWNWNWFPSGAGTALGWFVYSLAIIVFVAIVGFLVWFLVRDYLPGIRHQGIASKQIKIDLARVEDLPFEAKLDMGDPLAAAMALKARADYDAALIYLYGYMLLALDGQRHIFLQKGKTNRMYLREIASVKLGEITHMCMLAFEDSYFGKHATTQERFQAIWEQVDNFNQLAAQAPESKTPVVPTLEMTV